MLDFPKNNLVLGTKIGAFVQLLNFVIQQLSPFLLIVQVENLVHDMIFIQGQTKTIDKTLVEYKFIGSVLLIVLTALHIFTEAELVIYGQYIKVVFTNINM